MGLVILYTCDIPIEGKETEGVHGRALRVSRIQLSVNTLSVLKVFG